MMWYILITRIQEGKAEAGHTNPKTDKLYERPHHDGSFGILSQLGDTNKM